MSTSYKVLRYTDLVHTDYCLLWVLQ